MSRQGLVLCASLLALGACGKPADKAAPGQASGPAATSPAAAPAAPAAAMGMPTRAAGLWKQTIHVRGRDQTLRVCLDGDTDKKMALWSQGGGMERCSKSEHHRGLDGSVTFESECDMGPAGHVSSKGKAVGDFSSHYTVTIEGTVTGAMSEHMNGATVTTIEAVREGACPAGWKGGDMEMPGVGKVNITDMQKRAEQLRGLSGKMQIRP